MSELSKYWFKDKNEGRSFLLELDFSELFEKQDSMGNFNFYGVELKRDMEAEFFSKNVNRGTPVVCSGPLNRECNVSMSVTRRQATKELHDHFKSIHSGIDLRRDGTFKFSSRGARKAFLKARGVVDRDGGYGDG